LQSCWPRKGGGAVRRAAAGRWAASGRRCWAAWFRDRITAGDRGISRVTAYRYLDEVIIVLTEQAPDLHKALERAKDAGGLAGDPGR
jgi:hypothetical protein